METITIEKKKYVVVAQKNMKNYNLKPLQKIVLKRNYLSKLANLMLTN